MVLLHHAFSSCCETCSLALLQEFREIVMSGLMRRYGIPPWPYYKSSIRRNCHLNSPAHVCAVQDRFCGLSIVPVEAVILAVHTILSTGPKLY